MLSLTFYGGVNEIGGNKVLLEDEGTSLFFDFGTPFAKRYPYFEEYLKPRPGVGLLDLLEMGLLPPLRGIYREDLSPREEIWQRFEPSYLHVDGVLLSHAHVDHSGYISFLKEDIPIYSTAMTAFIAKAMQDSGGTDFEKEVCYLSPRVMKEGYLSAVGQNYRQRQFEFLGGFPEGEEAKYFWNRSWAATKRLKTAPVGGLPQQVGSLPLRYFPVDHSIFGASAFAVRTSMGWVSYTGDLRLHGVRGGDTERFIQEMEALGPYILICEGTRAGDERQSSEDEVYENALGAVREARGLVIADFGPRNVERLITFHRIARETSRRLVVLAKDAYLLHAMRLASPDIPDPGSLPEICIYQDVRGRVEGWQRDVLKRYRDKLVKASDVQMSPDDFILCFSFWDIKNLIDIAPEGGVYIYSSSEAYNEEQQIDHYRLRNWIDHFNLTLIGDPDKGGGGFHASGHASGPELLELIERVRPKFLIPIHTQDAAYFAAELDGKGIEVRIPKLGGRMVFPK